MDLNIRICFKNYFSAVKKVGFPQFFLQSTIQKRFLNQGSKRGSLINDPNGFLIKDLKGFLILIIDPNGSLMKDAKGSLIKGPTGSLIKGPKNALLC